MRGGDGGRFVGAVTEVIRCKKMLFAQHSQNAALLCFFSFVFLKMKHYFYININIYILYIVKKKEKKKHPKE